VAIETAPSAEPETRGENGLGSIPRTVKRNTLLLSAGQTLYTVVAQINVLLGAFMILGLTGDVRLAGLGTAIAWGGRLLIAYHSGKLMDRLGRVKVLQLGTGLSLGGAIVVAASLFANSLLGTVSGLVVYGLGVGATNQNRVAVADMFPAKRRGEGIGYLLTGSVVGALAATPYVAAGTLLTAYLGFETYAVYFGHETFALQYDAVLWLTTTVLLLAAMVLTAAVRPDPKKIAQNLSEYYPAEKEKQDPSSKDSPGNSVRISSYPVLATFAVSGLTQGNMTMNMAFVPEVLHFHGTAFAVISIAVTLHIIGMYGLSTPLGRWADKVGRQRALMLGASISGVGALVTPLATDFWTITLGIFLVGLGWSAATVGSTALLSDLSRAGERGRVIGLNDFFLGAAALIFPTAGGLILGSSRDFSALALFGFLASIPALVLAFFLREKT
jgi:MFS family permease